MRSLVHFAPGPPEGRVAILAWPRCQDGRATEACQDRFSRELLIKGCKTSPDLRDNTSLDACQAAISAHSGSKGESHVPSPLIVYSGILAPDREDLVGYLERVDASARRLGHELLLLNRGFLPVPTSSRTASIPHTPELEATYGPLLRDSDVDEIATRAAAVLNCQGTLGFEASLRNLLLYRRYMADFLDRLDPCLCILSVQFHAHHFVLRRMCEQRGLPFVYQGGGVLPGTFAFEPAGQMGASLVARHSQAFCQLPLEERDLETTRRYLQRARAERLCRKPQTSEEMLRPLIESLRNSARRVIFYAGQNDFFSGIVPPWLPGARLHSPHFVDTLDALDCLSLLARKNNWRIVFKPHPNIEDRYDALPISCPKRVTMLKGANIFECMEECDATVTVFSQVSYLALLHDHPGVLLGCNQMSGKGCAYEIENVADVETKIVEACENGTTPVMPERWLRHAAQLLKYYLYAWEPEVAQIAGRDTDALASHLIRQSKAASPQEQADLAWTLG
jgi:hypothetical protein